MSNELSVALTSKVTGTVNAFDTAIGGRFFPKDDKKEETAVKPYAVYSFPAQVQDDTFDAEIDNMLIRIKNVSNSSSKYEADNNNKLIRELLEGTTLEVSGHENVQLFRENQIPAMRLKMQKE